LRTLPLTALPALLVLTMAPVPPRVSWAEKP
jgi:hypothetical protein